MFWRRNWRISFLIVPQNGVENGGIVGVRTRKVHLLRQLRPGRASRVYLIDTAVIAIAPVGSEWRLIAGSRKKSKQDGSITIVLIHRWKTEQSFDGVNQIHGGIEAVLDKGLLA